MDKNGQNRGGARVANPDYKKVRRDVFSMVEQLVEANTHLSDVVRDKHYLLKKASLRVAELRDQVAHLEATEVILKHKIEIQRQDIINQEHDKAFDPDCKIEKGDVN
jgi:hypothetical protein